MKSTSWLLLLGSGILLAGLASDRVGAQQAGQDNNVVKIDGLTSRAPADWMAARRTGSPFRVREFRLEPVRDDKDPAEVVIFYFGAEGGGAVDANLKRWKSMFIPPEGRKIDDVAKVQKLKVSGDKVTYLDIHGTYLFRTRPMDSETARRPNYRMLAVIFETKEGPYYIRLVGPADTVGFYKKEFDDWLKGFKR